MNAALLPEELKAMPAIEQMYQALGAPLDPPHYALLGVALERIMKACADKKMWYPRVVFKRRKQLQEGSWRPAIPMLAAGPLRGTPKPEAVARDLERRRKEGAL